MKAHVTIYTDGTATGGKTVGGAAMVATVGDPADLVIIHTSKAFTYVHASYAVQLSQFSNISEAKHEIEFGKVLFT